MLSPILTVSEILDQIKNLLEGQFRQVSLSGEVSNLSKSGTGHYYFTISDANSSLSCCLFKMDAARNSEIKLLKNGDKINCFGSLGVYSKRGSFQLICRRIQKAGKGDLKEEFEKLKSNLAAQGLFSLEEKKSIPKLPKRIAVITASGAAALQDFVNIYKRRSIWCDLVLIPALVQGESAPESLRKALHNAIKYSLNVDDDSKKFDVIVLTRGGGSMEDLWAFNDEALAWDIYNCPIPVISAVGHEVDFTIADMVSDRRCETPSAAAELLSEGQVDLREKLNTISRRLRYSVKDKLIEKKQLLNKSNPQELLSIYHQKFNQLSKRLYECRIDSRIYELTGYYELMSRLEDCKESLNLNFPLKVERFNHRIENLNNLLSAMNPDNVLNRGYAYLKNKNGEIVKSKEQFDLLDKSTKMYIKFKDGQGAVQKC